MFTNSQNKELTALKNRTFYRPQMRRGNAVGRVCVSAFVSVFCPVRAVTIIRTSFLVPRYIFRTPKSRSSISMSWGQGQRHYTRLTNTFADRLPSTERQTEKNDHVIRY